eukprot:4010641-Amphidinium_carterae.1
MAPVRLCNLCATSHRVHRGCLCPQRAAVQPFWLKSVPPASAQGGAAFVQAWWAATAAHQTIVSYIIVEVAKPLRPHERSVDVLERELHSVANGEAALGRYPVGVANQPLRLVQTQNQPPAWHAFC